MNVRRSRRERKLREQNERMMADHAAAIQRETEADEADAPLPYDPMATIRALRDAGDNREDR